MLSKSPFKRTLYGLHHSSVALGLAIIWPRNDFIGKIMHLIRNLIEYI